MMKKFAKSKMMLYAVLLICVFMSIFVVIGTKNHDLKYERYISDFYENIDSNAISYEDNVYVVVHKTDDSMVPVVPDFIKGIVVFLSVFITGLVVINTSYWRGFIFFIIEATSIMLAQWLLFWKDILYMPVILLELCLVGSFIVIYSSKYVITTHSARLLSIGVVVKFIKNIVNMDEIMTYSEYISDNKTYIEHAISAKIIEAEVCADSEVVEALLEENHRNRKLVESKIVLRKRASDKSVIQVRSNVYKGVKYLVFIPLPIFDRNEEKMTYTVIGVENKLSVQSASYISTMIFSIYIYFCAKRERGKYQKIYLSMIDLIISVIDAKDPVTAGHSKRVADISSKLGHWLNLDKNSQFDLELASIIHDIGKIGVSDYVLNKPSVFTKEDFEQMKNHTVRGAEMLAEVGMSDNIIDGVRHHHERIDGLGYPDGIGGDKLNIIAKIIKIADVYDALTSKRQYKEAWKIDKALNIIYKGRGKEFDSEIADVFIKHMAPPGWLPPIDGKIVPNGIDKHMEQAINIAVDFYQRYSQVFAESFNIRSVRLNQATLECDKNFMMYDWGETFNNAKFLENKPMIMAYEKKSESILFAQSSSDEYVESVYYYFFKGFINLGVFLLRRDKVRETLDKLTNIYGKAVEVSDQFFVYRHDKLRVVFYHTSDDKCLLFYAPEYICANYIFEPSQNDMCS